MEGGRNAMEYDEIHFVVISIEGYEGNEWDKQWTGGRRKECMEGEMKDLGLKKNR